nr:YraN family protein [Celeribacter neptunius]
MAEESVARDYQARGFTLLEQRWRGAGGEIDLIFEKDGELVFVEVKASKTHARAALLLGPKQIARLSASAEDYIGHLPRGLLTPMRIDVALVDGAGQVEILENALM